MSWSLNVFQKCIVKRNNAQADEPIPDRQPWAKEAGSYTKLGKGRDSISTLFRPLAARWSNRKLALVYSRLFERNVVKTAYPPFIFYSLLKVIK